MSNLLLRQASLPDLCPVTAAIETLAQAGGIEERGAIFTRREVVDFILDLTGYTEDRPLHEFSLLEPSFGNGDFLLPAIDRLLNAWTSSKQTTDPLEEQRHLVWMRARHDSWKDISCWFGCDRQRALKIVTEHLNCSVS